MSFLSLVDSADTKVLFDLDSTVRALFKLEKCLPGYCQMIKLLNAFLEWVLVIIQKTGTLICKCFVINCCHYKMFEFSLIKPGQDLFPDNYARMVSIGI